MTFPTKVPFRGIAFEHGDEFFIIPPVPIGKVRKAQEDINDIKVPTGAEAADSKWVERRQDIMIELVVDAFHLNYPEITREQILPLINMRNLGPFYFAACGETDDRSGKPIGIKQDVKSVGELKAPGVPESLTAGATSTQE